MSRKLIGLLTLSGLTLMLVGFMSQTQQAEAGHRFFGGSCGWGAPSCDYDDDDCFAPSSGYCAPVSYCAPVRSCAPVRYCAPVSYCAPAPVCCPAPAPVCCPAPVVTYAPAPIATCCPQPTCCAPAATCCAPAPVTCCNTSCGGDCDD